MRSDDTVPAARFFLLQRSEHVGPAALSVEKRLLSISRHVIGRCAIFCCIVCLLPLGGNALASNELSARKRAFTEKLDSIDLEKQLHKRRGESLEDLEKASEALKDSIAALKRQMPQQSGQGQESEQVEDSVGKSAASGATVSGRLQPFQKYLPKTLFDWIVDVVAFIAIISGIVLLIGIFGLISRGFKKKKKAAPIHQPLHEIFPRSYAADAYDRIPKVPGGQTEENNETIASLRKRVADAGAPPRGQDDEGVLATVDDSEAGGGNDPSGKPPGAQELKKQVLLAAQKGLDVSEISRRFHLSSDEVSLILRMARRDDAGSL
jgi:hypothetical protein